MAFYRGKRGQYGEAGSALVTVVDGEKEIPLPPRNDLWNHSPDGFNFGYSGSGPAQLALAILAHHLKDDDRAVRLHQWFKRTFITTVDGDEFEITSERIDEWLREEGCR